MNALKSLFWVSVLVAVLLAVVTVGVLKGGQAGLVAFGIIIPYAALALFVLGLIIRIVKWIRVPVPFSISTTCGQQKSLTWIKSDPLENPPNKFFVLIRMALEVLTFRSLFRNTNIQLTGQRVIYTSNQLLWLASIAFHYCFLLIILRHLRFFTEPVLFFVPWLEYGDGLLQIGAPRIYMTGLIIVAALGYLLLRRIMFHQLRYISLPSDYLALFLILAVAISGDLMRYIFKVDVVKVKELAMGLVTGRYDLSLLPEIGLPFYIHLFFVSLLVAYFPFSKMTHMAGVFLSPTRNLIGASRMVRHVNPWNYDVDVHTYKEWEEEFKDKLIMAELPLEEE